jgi:hypothetical protein
MDSAIYCLIGPEGKVFVKAGADSYADVAATYGLVEAECDKYRVDVPTRRLMADRADPSSAAGARQFVVLHLGSPERLMEFASEGLSRSEYWRIC